ncbi:hypothetical protein GALMADRAFT_928523 [Galerina marginata CBS 339.88]|uniref:Uncharacterized protein n=1 Tax=Galerina marginata (strain CBS 339.88) TaxID=685588 RepID=A0A067SR88_GALM3|nr:hypothetical protein GALMADRAFT_928523 [Galerina marginata CBS 339.88]
MTSRRNEARARRGDPKRSNKTRAQSDDVTDSVQIGPSGATRSAPLVAQPEDAQGRIWTTDDDREAYRQPAIARYPTESVIPTRPVAPLLDTRSQTYPRAAGHSSQHEAHLVYPPMTSFGGSNTHSGNESTSSVEGSHNYEPTTIRNSTLSNTTHHLNSGNTVYIGTLNLYSSEGMHDGLSRHPARSIYLRLALGNADLPTTSTATSNSYDTRSIHDQPRTPGADSHINPCHFVSSQHTQQQPLGRGPTHGIGGPSQIPGSSMSGPG